MIERDEADGIPLLWLRPEAGNDRRRLVLSLSADGKKLAGAMRHVGHDRCVLRGP